MTYTNPFASRDTEALFTRFWRGAFVQPGIGSRIRARRRHLGYSQQRLADLTGMSRQHLSTIEIGSVTPSPFFAARLADALQVSPGWLTGEEADDESIAA